MTFPTIPSTQYPLVIDISHWQGNVDFAKMKSNGASGVISKAGQGTYEDIKFKDNYFGAKSVGFPVGAYWYYDNRVDPTVQANRFAEIIGTRFPDLGIWLDLEDANAGKFIGWKYWYVFLERIKILLPRQKIGIYTGYYYWREHTSLSGISIHSLEYFKQYPLWIAYYYVSNPQIPKPWDSCLLHQFTDLLDGHAYGAESKELDGNYYFGEATTPPPTETGESMIVGTALGNVNIRSGPSGDYPSIGFLKVGDKIEADKNSAQWLHLTKVNGVAVTQEAWASAGANEQYISWEVVTTPPVEPPPSGATITHAIQVRSDGKISVDNAPFT